MTCGECRFWFSQETQCRRYAPQPADQPPAVGAAPAPLEARWPAVKARDWCGEFQPAVVSPGDRITGR